MNNNVLLSMNNNAPLSINKNAVQSMNNSVPMYQVKSVQLSMNNNATQFQDNNAAQSWRPCVMGLDPGEDHLEVIVLQVAPVVMVVAVEAFQDLAGQNHLEGPRKRSQDMEKDQLLADQGRIMEVQEVEEVAIMTGLGVAAVVQVAAQAALGEVTPEVPAALEASLVALEVLVAQEEVDMGEVLEVDQEVVVDKFPDNNAQLFKNNNVKMFQDNNAKQ